MMGLFCNLFQRCMMGLDLCVNLLCKLHMSLHQFLVKFQLFNHVGLVQPELGICFFALANKLVQLCLHLAQCAESLVGLCVSLHNCLLQLCCYFLCCFLQLHLFHCFFSLWTRCLRPAANFASVEPALAFAFAICFFTVVLIFAICLVTCFVFFNALAIAFACNARTCASLAF